MAARVLILQRGRATQLGRCLLASCRASPEVSDVALRRDGDDSGGGLRANRAVHILDARADDECYPPALALDPEWEQVIAIHDRARYALMRDRPPPLPSRTHTLHVFCDAGLLGAGEPDPFAEAVASRVAGWLGMDGDAREGTRLRSGTYINAHNNRGNLVLGVMSGGTKDPLGAGACGVA